MSEPDSSCPLCDFEPERLIASNDLAIALWDKFPVSGGHCLICPRRHVSDFWELNEAEIVGLHRLLADVRSTLDHIHAPAGYNVGVNIGAAAGQTVLHVHLHLIPRYPGDVADPTGGVRHVIPGKGNYRKQTFSRSAGLPTDWGSRSDL